VKAPQALDREGQGGALMEARNLLTRDLEQWVTWLPPGELGIGDYAGETAS
jgi:hypothetical protein